MFDNNKALEATGRMWLRLARHLDKYATNEAKAGHVSTALRAARTADACYWQATGEADAINLKDVI